MISNNLEEQQCAEWEALYEKIKRLLVQCGGGRCIRKGRLSHCRRQLRVEPAEDRSSFAKNVEATYHRTASYATRRLPDWQIVIAVDVPGKEHWPLMGVTIRKHEIIDGLRREVLPPEFNDFKIPGSRLGTGFN